MDNVQHHHHYHEALRERKWRVALVLSILFGMVGADRMYLGHIGLGVLKLITMGGFGLWGRSST